MQCPTAGTPGTQEKDNMVDVQAEQPSDSPPALSSLPTEAHEGVAHIISLLALSDSALP